MALLEIIHYPNPILLKVAKPVEVFDGELQKFTEDMLKSMYANQGIGLAAPQVSVSRRIIVIDVSEERNQPIAIINPMITQKNGERIYEEGCLSVPGFVEEVMRADTIELTYQDIAGNQQTLFVEGLLATCIQHEIDHLDGKLFIEYLSPLKKNRIKQKLKKIAHYQ